MTDFTAEDAQALLDNQILKNAFINVREKVVSQLEQLPPNNDRIRDELVIALQMLISVRRDIENDIQTQQLNETGEDVLV